MPLDTIPNLIQLVQFAQSCCTLLGYYVVMIYQYLLFYIYGIPIIIQASNYIIKLTFNNNELLTKL